ncbi:MAG: transcription termination factor NusA [Oscillospiraceae bacterium]|jgi:N utilization substance protein A|nr:transcription termination factor NusA [Oscillospiraceae bacterium]
MQNEILEALNLLNIDKGITLEYMVKKISKAISIACKSAYGVEQSEPLVKFDAESGKLVVKIDKLVVENVQKPDFEVCFEEAKEINPEVVIGDFVKVPLDPKKFGRIAAQVARNVIRQGIQEGERDLITKQLRDCEGKIVTAQVVRISPQKKIIILKIGECEALLPKAENHLVPKIREGDYLKVYILRVESGESSPRIIISRACPEFVKKLFETEVPEIADETVQIKAIAREAGLRTKIAVESSMPEVEPVGACIGPGGSRIKEISNELGEEKVDVIRYYGDFEKFIESAIAPASVVSVEKISEEESNLILYRVTVPDNQISLAIGARGLNVRLASKLTGCKIDLKPESGYYDEKN